jgi:hypothetical protein
MNIHYVCIDSLCVRQDKDDVAGGLHEVALIHKVDSTSVTYPPWVQPTSFLSKRRAAYIISL